MKKFNCEDSLLIQNIILDINNKVSIQCVSGNYNITKWYVRKIYLHFNNFNTLEEIQKELDSIKESNNVKKIYIVDHKLNYQRNAEYYKKWHRKRTLKLRLLKAQKLIDDNREVYDKLVT